MNVEVLEAISRQKMQTIHNHLERALEMVSQLNDEVSEQSKRLAKSYITDAILSLEEK